eukprot:7035533-Pyramimonas_sp.AAC.1
MPKPARRGNCSTPSFSGDKVEGICGPPSGRSRSGCEIPRGDGNICTPRAGDWHHSGQLRRPDTSGTSQRRWLNGS